ncbi:hypothetical protein [Burkholderia cenocepacia]|uniref:hypothetical protein n=1 Tax=Burkholderia cenocepacia TaxID=95486 RepID=UPI001B9B7EE0|nr:hypothetical protein [Burkholderia cenocepacia]MBR7942321.1 hypothetical protein [Burkholderia cenocepacia]
MTTENSRADALTNYPREVEEMREALRGDGFVPVLPELQPAAAPIDALALSENELSAILSASLNSYMTTAERDCLRNLMRRVKAANPIVQPAPAPQPSPADERAAFVQFAKQQGYDLTTCEQKGVISTRCGIGPSTYWNEDTEHAWRGWANARASSANEPGAEGADALAHEVWSAAQRAPGEGIEDAVQRIAAILSRSPAMAAQPARAWETDDGRVISNEQKQQALRDGGASASSVRPFSIALGRIGAVPAMAAEAVAIPAGWKAMPPSATTAMRMAMAKAAAEYMQRTGGNSPDAIYEAAFAAAPQPAQADARIDVEAMLRACVPGGDICDPQRIADSIREWFDDHGAQADAREGLTAEQVVTIRSAARVLDDARWPNLANDLRALLQGANQ